MESMRGLGNSLPGSAARQSSQIESPEELLRVFKEAALSVTKLYRTSTSVQSKARLEGYQECLDDLLAYLDKEKIGLSYGEGGKIRRWVSERRDGREGSSQNTESEDEVDRAETASSPELTRATPVPQPSTQMRNDSAPPTILPIVEEPALIPEPIVVPTLENFTYQSSHAYPNIANLDLSDSRAQDGSSISANRFAKSRLNAGSSRSGSRSSAHYGQRAGSKRKLNFDEIFDYAGLGGGKDPFGNGPKRNRHA